MPAKAKQFRRPSRVEPVSFPLDPNDAKDLRPLQSELQSARTVVEDAGADATLEQHKAVEDAEAAYNAALVGKETVTFTFQALSGARLQILQTENPPTDDQLKIVKVTDPDATLEYDPEKYPPELMVAACTKVEWSDGTVAKKLTVAQATDFYETSSAGDQEFLMTAIGMLNNIPSLLVALGKG